MRNYVGTDKRDPDAIQKIDYFLRDVAAAMGRISNGESPVGSGATLAGTSSHHNLNDLTNHDDHPQYLFLDGRSPRQTIAGSTRIVSVPLQLASAAGDTSPLELWGGGGSGALTISRYQTGNNIQIGTLTGPAGLTPLPAQYGGTSNSSFYSTSGPLAIINGYDSNSTPGAGTINLVGAVYMSGRHFTAVGPTAMPTLVITQDAGRTEDLTRWLATDHAAILSRVDKDGKFFFIGDADAQKPAFTVQDLASGSGGPTFDLQVVAGQAGGFSVTPSPCYLMPGTMLAKPAASDVNLTGQTANIGSTHLTSTSGAILICAMMSCVATGTGIVSLYVQYANEIGTINQRVCDLSMATAGATSVTTMALPIYDAVGDVHYTISSYASGTYNLRIRAVGLGT